MQSSKVFLLGCVIAASTAASALADGGHYHDHGMMGGSWFFGPIMMLLFIVLIVAAIILTARLLGFVAGNRSSSNSLDVLKNRFAKGEIDKDEFEERKRIMSS